MDFRLEYISKLFEKTSKKRIENYVITRIWHMLSDLEVKFVPQQYVKRNSNQYALTDLYLPQIGLHVEINEPAHYCSEERVEIDRLRKHEIEKNTNHFVIEVDCREPLEKIHQKIDDIVNVIKEQVERQKKENCFRPWGNGYEFTPDYHKKKGFLRVQDEPCLRTIDDICALFDAKVPMRGFLRQGAIIHPTQTDLIIWWPIENNKLWENKLAENDNIIFEKHRDSQKRENHVKSLINNDHKRAVFFFSIDVLGFRFYRFKGIYKIDKNQTSLENGLVWKRIENELILSQAPVLEYS